MQALLDAIATSAALPQDAQRLFHGRGGLHPGCEHLTLDVYPPALLLTSFEPLADEALAAIGAAITARWPEAPWVFQCRQEGGRVQTRLMAGTLPDPHVVTEAGIPGIRYLVHLLRGQNHGLFLDMAEGRRWVREHVSPGARVLNLFAYTCAFSVVALQAGAAEVVNVDMSDGALAIGRRNHELNGVKAGAKFLAHDIFNSWGKLTRGGPYDLVICDPPSFQKGSFVATKDYARLAKRLPALLAPGGQALLCLNTPKLGPDFLHGVVVEHAPELAFVERVPNPVAFADVSEDRALKVLAYRLP
ncbi:SAM-dependent methyltransferase [Pelomonas sp. Root1217]|uniref:class I SAM-dependent methyltransferase n=1 Tax=Pelomonas sp. Root1217 TaxID=1736430 RepID=UPI00070BB49E|nr:class I SAM-dependent methyltransferase [Pelomonas sp. Root1217]KQV53147.1 SAM-dependent methyltransferase [Pelomonas sp. Root1217]